MNLGQYHAGFVALVFCYSITPHGFADDISHQLPVCLNLISVNITGEQKKNGKRKKFRDILTEMDTSL